MPSFYCFMPTLQTTLDTSDRIVTPENIAFEYRLAGPFRRYGAWLIDLLVQFLILLLVGLIASLFAIFDSGVIGLPLTLLSIFFLLWFYGGFFETWWNGQTPGKRALGLRVVGIQGEPINAWQAVLRNVLRYADLLPWLPVTYFTAIFLGETADEGGQGLPVPLGIVGLISCMLTPRMQRLGDLASGTMVIVEERPFIVGLAMLRDPMSKQAAADLPLDLRVPRRTARALAKYVERRRVFTPQRRAELSRRLVGVLRQRYRIPPQMDDDRVLCGLYYRTFIGESES
jgi:uncharacterized RDD family membrane protein YckC